jgi:hypothetical protein
MEEGLIEGWLYRMMGRKMDRNWICRRKGVRMGRRKDKRMVEAWVE